MPLSIAQTSGLFESIESIHFNDEIARAESLWQKSIMGKGFSLERKIFKDLQDELIYIRNASLARKSVIIPPTEGINHSVRVYDPYQAANISADVGDIFARGIDSARAVTEMFRLAKIQQTTLEVLEANENLLTVIRQFQMRMAAINQADPNDLKQAKTELKRFNGALSDLLVQHAVVADRKTANSAINFVRDFLWKKDICIAHCVVQPNGYDFRTRDTLPQDLSEEKFKNSYVYTRDEARLFYIDHEGKPEEVPLSNPISFIDSLSLPAFYQYKGKPIHLISIKPSDKIKDKKYLNSYLYIEKTNEIFWVNKKGIVKPIRNSLDIKNIEDAVKTPFSSDCDKHFSHHEFLRLLPEETLHQPKQFTQLRYAEPAFFSNQDSSLSLDDYSNPHPLWLQALRQQMGADSQHPWFEQFLEDHLNQLSIQSSTPMSRFTPNPANAFYCTDAIIADKEISSLAHFMQLAITEPLNIKDTEERQRVADYNHRQLLSEKRLEAEIEAFMEKWGEVLGTSAVITLPVLHQTFIGDEVSFSSDQAKARATRLEASLINSKQAANTRLKTFLGQHRLVYNKNDKTLTYFKNDDFPPSLAFNQQEIKIALLETNDCINMWHDRARVRNNDVDDARRLIEHAVSVFETLRPYVKDKERALNTVIAFLKSSDHSFFTPYKFRGTVVKSALQSLTAELQRGDSSFTFLDNKAARENLALSLYAAVELKCCVHETWAGSLRRIVGNFTRDYCRRVPLAGHLIDWVVRGSMAVSAFFVKRIINAIELLSWIVKLPFMETNRPQFMLHGDDRKVLFKAANTGLLAETLGVVHCGCASALDRGGEMAEQRAARRLQFNQTGKFVSYNDTEEMKQDFFSRYGSTQAKHGSCENGTGSAGSNDNESRGIFNQGLMSSRAETLEEQEIAKAISSPLRKGQYDDNETFASYMGNQLHIGSQIGPKIRGALSRFNQSLTKSNSHNAGKEKQEEEENLGSSHHWYQKS